jgi:hypothetical protein
MRSSTAPRERRLEGRNNSSTSSLKGEVDGAASSSPHRLVLWADVTRGAPLLDVALEQSGHAEYSDHPPILASA